MGETRVDLLHLLEDLRDAYPASLEETIVGEIVANALDSDATTISLETTPDALIVRDNGSGMARGELRRYHDLAASTKTRGQTIGFAGVGIKLGLLACDEVFTETRHGASYIATSWRLASRHRAPWSWSTPLGLVSDRGTAVRLRPSNPLSPLLDPTFLTSSLTRQYEPLIDPAFGPALAARYPQGVSLLVNGSQLALVLPSPGERAVLAARIGRQRKPSAIGYLGRSSERLPENRRGLALSTLGKVIVRGWDWLGVTPRDPERVTGLVEAPGLAAALTLNKGDFIRAGRRGALYLAYRKALQEAVAAQLAAWGDAPELRTTERRNRLLERDMERVLAELADQFPLVATLVDWRRGGQRRMVLGPGDGSVIPATAPAPASTVASTADAVSSDATAPTPATEPPLQGGTGPKRAAHSGLSIRFEPAPPDAPLGRLVESTIWVNESHPAYRRAVATNAHPYHVALTVGLTLAPLAAERGTIPEFVTTFLACWGQTNGSKNGRRSRRRNRGRQSRQ
jgi:hypothetical protein